MIWFHILRFWWLKERNIAFVSKWCWRFPIETDSLWFSIISSIHGLDRFGWFTDQKRGFKGNSPWQFVNSCRKKLTHILDFKLGNGERVYFWHDRWIGDLPLKRSFPRLFNIASNKLAVVKDYWFVDGASWNVLLKRPLYDREINDFISLLHILQPIRIENREDVYNWKLNCKGFSTASMYNYLTTNGGLLEEKLAKCIWKNGCPKKINFFNWNLAVGGLNTADLIQRRNPRSALSPNVCILCTSTSESQKHLFFHCNFAGLLWQKLLQTFCLNWCLADCPKQNLHSLLTGHPFKGQAKWLWEKAVKVITWELWLERNHRIFENKSNMVNEVWELIQFKVSHLCFSY